MPHGTLIAGKDYAPLGTRNEEGRPLYEILREIDLGGDRVVPVGFFTDFGSIPRMVDNIFGIDTRRGSMAYLTHDYNYRYKARPRIIADIELRFDQRKEGIGLLERSIVFWALRVGGAKAYNRGSIETGNAA